MFKTPPEVNTPITRLSIHNDKVFTAANNEVRGYTKKFTNFYFIETLMTEPIKSMYVQSAHRSTNHRTSTRVEIGGARHSSVHLPAQQYDLLFQAVHSISHFLFRPAGIPFFIIIMVMLHALGLAFTHCIVLDVTRVSSAGTSSKRRRRSTLQGPPSTRNTSTTARCYHTTFLAIRLMICLGCTCLPRPARS